MIKNKKGRKKNESDWYKLVGRNRDERKVLEWKRTCWTSRLAYQSVGP